MEVSSDEANTLSVFDAVVTVVRDNVHEHREAYWYQFLYGERAKCYKGPVTVNELLASTQEQSREGGRFQAAGRLLKEGQAVH